MKWVYTIGRIAGTEVKVHLTFVLFLAWWALSGYQEGGSSGAVTAALLLLALFACILLHEFGHILMARRFGVRTPDVILLPIGGVARLERIPEEPRQELLIALAGPVVTAVSGPDFLSAAPAHRWQCRGGSAESAGSIPESAAGHQRLAPAVQYDPRVSDGWRAGAAGTALQPNGTGSGHPRRGIPWPGARHRRRALRHYQRPSPAGSDCLLRFSRGRPPRPRRWRPGPPAMASRCRR